MDEHLIKKLSNHRSSDNLKGSQLKTELLLKDENKEIPLSKMCGKYHWNHIQGSKQSCLAS